MGRTEEEIDQLVDDEEAAMAGILLAGAELIEMAMRVREGCATEADMRRAHDAMRAARSRHADVIQRMLGPGVASPVLLDRAAAVDRFAKGAMGALGPA